MATLASEPRLPPGGQQASPAETPEKEAPSLLALPQGVLDVLLQEQNETTRALLKHVCRDLRRAVAAWEKQRGLRSSRFIVCDVVGDVGLLRWARSKGIPWNRSICAAAAKTGSLPSLQLARELGCPWDELTCLAAVKNGHFHVFQWAIAAGCPCDAG